jgi:hypothetical protein
LLKGRWCTEPAARAGLILPLDYQTPLEGVLALELVITPDLQDAGAYATLREWRVA